jgi:hypothetical protein
MDMDGGIPDDSTCRDLTRPPVLLESPGRASIGLLVCRRRAEPDGCMHGGVCVRLPVWGTSTPAPMTHDMRQLDRTPAIRAELRPDSGGSSVAQYPTLPRVVPACIRIFVFLPLPCFGCLPSFFCTNLVLVLLQ